MIKSLGHYINGKWSISGDKAFSTYSPVNGEIYYEGLSADKKTLQSAVDSARIAYQKWCLISVSERAPIIRSLINEIQKDKNKLSEVISLETGKPNWESLSEVQGMITKFQVSLDSFHQRTPERLREGSLQLSSKPLGVLGVLGPFNFPGHLPHGHIIPALIAGNAIVFKPSEHTPLTAQAYMECVEKSSIPEGLINLIQGGAGLGKDLSTHEELDGLLFTGSAKTGKLLSEHYGKYPEKMLALEMGGNNPLILSNPNDLSASTYQMILSSFISSGQRCSCSRRLLLIDTPENHKLLKRFVEMTQKIRIGAPDSDPAPFMGPVIHDQSVDLALRYQEMLLQRGSNPILEAKKMNRPGSWMTPGIHQMEPNQLINDEECFAPIVQVSFVKNLEEAVYIANDTPYGLSAGLISGEEEDFNYFFAHIRAGVVNWNAPTTGASSKLPFGGVGHSGNLRPSAYYAADYCSYPVASQLFNQATLPETLSPGIEIKEA